MALCLRVRNPAPHAKARRHEDPLCLPNARVFAFFAVESWFFLTAKGTKIHEKFFQPRFVPDCALTGLVELWGNGPRPAFARKARKLDLGFENHGLSGLYYYLRPKKPNGAILDLRFV